MSNMAVLIAQYVELSLGVLLDPYVVR